MVPAFVLAVLSACDGGGDSYFPLEPGLRFDYRTDLNTEGTAPETLRSSAVNLAPRTLGDVVVTPQLHQDGRTLFYAENAEGIRLVGFQKPGEDAITEIPNQYILKYPLEAGATWRTPGRTVLLTERFLASKALPVRIGIDLAYKIETVNTDVRVPAGHFFDCIKIVAEGHTTVTTADNQRTLNVDVAITEWYAPGVGLVKAMRSERAGAERAGNADAVTELEYVKRRSWFQ